MKEVSDLVKLLFYGTQDTDPMNIIKSSYGVDNRFDKPGAYGRGSIYSNNLN